METNQDTYHSGKAKRRRLREKGEKKVPTMTAKNAERERSRVKSLRQAFQAVQACLPSVPPNTKLSKLDILILATNYISHLTKMLAEDEETQILASTTFACDLKYLHPVKKWPMRSRLYAQPEEKGLNNVDMVETSPLYDQLEEQTFILDDAFAYDNMDGI